jgi:hypothetical protein
MKLKLYSIQKLRFLFYLVTVLILSVFLSKNPNMLPKIILSIVWVLFLIRVIPNKIAFGRYELILLILSSISLAHSIFIILHYGVSSFLELRDSFFIWFFIPILYYLFISIKCGKIDKDVYLATAFIVLLFFSDSIYYYLVGQSYLAKIFFSDIVPGPRFSSLFFHSHAGSYIFITLLLNILFNRGKINPYIFLSAYIVILHTESRMISVYMLVIFAAYIFQNFKLHSTAIKLLVIGVCISLYLLFLSSDPIEGRMKILFFNIDKIYENQYLRINEFKTALNFIADNFVIGTSKEFYIDNKILYGEGILKHPHSMFLEILIYKGILGFIMVILYYGVTLSFLLKKMYVVSFSSFFLFPIIGPGDFGNTGFFILTILGIAKVLDLHEKSSISNKMNYYNHTKPIRESVSFDKDDLNLVTTTPRVVSHLLQMPPPLYNQYRGWLPKF